METSSPKYVNLCDCVVKLDLGGDGGETLMLARRYDAHDPIEVRTTVVTGDDEQYRQYHLVNRPSPAEGAVYFTEVKDIHLCLTDKKDDIVALDGFRKKDNAIDVSFNSLTRELCESKRSLALSRDEAELLWAVRDRAYERALLLLENGVNVNVCRRWGITALDMLCSSENIKGGEKLLTALLEAGADVNTRDWCGCTPFFRACKTGRLDIVKLLLSHGADVNVKNNLGEIPLHAVCGPIRYFASLEGLDALARLFVEEYDADVNARNKRGRTPLRGICWHGRIEVARFFIEHGANVKALDEDGDTPLHIASYRGHENIARLLLDHGADVNARDKDGDTPLHLACRRGHPDIAVFLMKHGADPGVHNQAGRVPLQLVSDENKDKIMELFEKNIRKEGDRMK